MVADLVDRHVTAAQEMYVWQEIMCTHLPALTSET